MLTWERPIGILRGRAVFERRGPHDAADRGRGEAAISQTPRNREFYRDRFSPLLLPLLFIHPERGSLSKIMNY